MRLFVRGMDALRTRWWNLRGRQRLYAAGAQVAPDLRCYGLPVVSRVEDSVIEIGHAVVLCSDTRYTALGVAHPVILRTLRPGARIIIGANCGLSGTSICAATEVRIGEECLFGADVMVFDTDFHALKPAGRRFNNQYADISTAPVYIGKNVFIGTGARIGKGVTIGDNSVIGAGAVVVRDIPANAVAAGNPARVLRSLEPTAGKLGEG